MNKLSSLNHSNNNISTNNDTNISNILNKRVSLNQTRTTDYSMSQENIKKIKN